MSTQHAKPSQRIRQPAHHRRVDDPQRLMRFHARVRAGETGLAYDATWWLLVRPMLAAYRVRAIDAHHVPADGPVILAPNHASYSDHFLLAGIAGRRLSFMAKSQLFHGPMLFMNLLGAFPVRQGVRDEDAFVTAHTVLARGGCLVVYIEGGRTRDGTLRERPKRGIGRLALESGAPVVPVALLDTHRIRPLRLPTITARFGAPMLFDHVAEPARTDQREVADAVFAQIRSLHAQLSADGHAAARGHGRCTGALWRARGR